ncbi:unnamed protein product [Leuciscus chuanchicus]
MFHALSFKTIFFIELAIVWLISHSSLSDALQERHHLHHMITSMTKGHSFNFSHLGLCDDGKISHYCNEVEAWIRKILIVDDSTKAFADSHDYRDWYKYELYELSNCTDSQCSDHVLQRITGCKLDKLPDGSVNLTVFDEYGFDGEDLISFNYDTMQWIDKNPKAKETKKKWDRQTGYNQFLQSYLKTCTEWISTFNNTNKSSPDVHVSVSKSPDDESKLVLTCLATGFYPRDVQMNIRLNRIHLENQTSSGIRPNDDETFQMRISVKIDRNHEGSYDCLVTHSSLIEPVTVIWDRTCIDCEIWIVIAGVAVLVLVLVLVLALFGFFIFKRKRRNGRVRNSSSYGTVDDQIQMASSADEIRS